MKAFIIDIYTAYRTTIIGDQDMKQLEAFFSTPADASLLLKFQVV
jgi:hypothetical protein